MERSKIELLVLANVVVGTSLLVEPVEALVAGVWQIFLVRAPRDSSVLEQVGDGGDVLGDLDEWVIVKTEVVTAMA
jgi:hypothetical protein